MVSRKQRQRRALAAGGIVLGVGAAAVAASWTDRVLGSSEFGSGAPFGIESSTNGSVWASHSVTGPNAMTFSANASALVPGSVVYAPIRLRTEAASPAANVRLQGATFTGTGTGNLSAALRYRVVRGAATCDATAFTTNPTFVVGAAGAVPLNSAAPADFSLLAGATTDVPGPAVALCFEIGLPTTNWTNSAIQSKALVATWAFVGTSS